MVYVAAIIGGAGGMGQWFAGHLSRLGIEVGISDVNSKRAMELANAYGYRYFESNTDAVRDADFVLVAVPMKYMEPVIDEVSSSMRQGAIICEISSFKMQHFSLLEKMNREGFNTLSLHPMFGPTAVRIEDLTFAVIPVKNRDDEVELANSLFPGADIVVVEVETHDRVMSHVLSLTYHMNLAFSMTINENDIPLFKKLAGTSFTLQMGLAESITLENRELVETILYSNHYAKETMERFIQNIEKLNNHDNFINAFTELNEECGDLDKGRVDNWRYKSYVNYRRAMKPGGMTPES